MAYKDTSDPALLRAHLIDNFHYDRAAGQFYRATTRTPLGGHDNRTSTHQPRVMVNGRMYPLAHLVWLVERGRFPNRLRYRDRDMRNTAISNLDETPVTERTLYTLGDGLDELRRRYAYDPVTGCLIHRVAVIGAPAHQKADYYATLPVPARYVRGAAKSIRATTAVWMLVHGPVPAGHVVRHVDGAVGELRSLLIDDLRLVPAGQAA